MQIRYPSASEETILRPRLLREIRECELTALRQLLIVQLR